MACGADTTPERTREGAGNVLLAYMLRDSFARGDRLYDMGVGSLESKRHFQTRLLPMLRYSHFPPLALRAQVLRLKRWWQGRRLPASIAVGRVLDAARPTRDELELPGGILEIVSGCYGRRWQCARDSSESCPRACAWQPQPGTVTASATGVPQPARTALPQGCCTMQHESRHHARLLARPRCVLLRVEWEHKASGPAFADSASRSHRPTTRQAPQEQAVSSSLDSFQSCSWGTNCRPGITTAGVPPHGSQGAGRQGLGGKRTGDRRGVSAGRPVRATGSP